jgi:Na+/melibiose symporter-like transporter
MNDRVIPPGPAPKAHQPKPWGKWLLQFLLGGAVGIAIAAAAQWVEGELGLHDEFSYFVTMVLMVLALVYSLWLRRQRQQGSNQ